MNLYTRNLIPVSSSGAVSPTFTVSPGAPVLVTLIDAGAPGPFDGALPACASARIQKENSLGTFNDYTFLGAGRSLVYLLDTPGNYRVVTPESTNEASPFGVDITSAEYGQAEPGPGPGPDVISDAPTR